MAAGLTVAADGLDGARRASSPSASRASLGPGLPPPPDLALDGALQVAALSPGLAERLGALGPVRRAATPSRASCCPTARSFQVRRIGEGHLDCLLQDAAGGRVRAVAFRAADRPLGAALLGAGGAPLHLAGTLKLDSWQGEARVSFRIEDAARLRLSAPCFAGRAAAAKGWHQRPHRLEVRTPPFQGGNRGSIPRGDASLSELSPELR